MKIILNINKILKDSIKDGRTNFFVWKDLGELKQHYSDVVDESTIDTIVDGIKKAQNNQNKRKYSFRKDNSSFLNEQGLCNLVEIELLKNREAFDTFMKKPVYNCLQAPRTKLRKQK
jgi:hypothetical protein